MRDLIVTENISVDGVIDLGQGWFDPQTQGDSDHSDLMTVLTEQGQAADAFLTGRVTFEQLRGYWQHLTGDQTGISDYLNRVRKYVVSATLGDPGWEPTTVLRGPLREEITALKSAPGRDIVVTGSITLVHALIAAGLVDEYRLFVYPVVAGQGARLFGGDGPGGLAGLRLAEARPFRSGVVLLRYRSLIGVVRPGGAGGARMDHLSRRRVSTCRSRALSPRARSCPCWLVRSLRDGWWDDAPGER